MNFDLTFQQSIVFGEIGRLANAQRLVDLESEQTLDWNLLKNQTVVIAQASQQKLKNVPSSHVQTVILKRSSRCANIRLKMKRL